MAVAASVCFWLISGIIFVVSFAQESSNNRQVGDLVFAHVLYRHGDRAPGILFPTDPNGPDAWPMGRRELTTVGMMQQYQLGQYLRKRYSKLLDKQYKVNEIYVRSSGKNRALQSAASNLAGLYPPTNYQIWNPRIHWQPIPIHSVHVEEDSLLGVDAPCPMYDAVFINQSAPLIQSYNKQYSDFFAYLKNCTGLKKVDLLSVGKVYDPLQCENQHGMKIPKWAYGVVNETTGQTVFDLVFDLKTVAKNLKFNSDEKALLTGGPLLGDIIARMINVSVGGNDSPGLLASKLVMYSSHDDVVMAFLYSLNVVDRPFLVPYAAAVFIDLYRHEGDKYYVQVSYKNDTPKTKVYHSSEENQASNWDSSSVDDSWTSNRNDHQKPLELVIPGCPGFQCPLETFVSALSNRTLYPVSRRNAACGIGRTSPILRWPLPYKVHDDDDD